ncbi:hypothetical protein [Paenibacillus sp. IITD108]|uniref:hypothetical protein n=1 Tax=Paenibacillus sp. IITD108 TaxID=3116649 RepID=UPI002F405B7F
MNELEAVAELVNAIHQRRVELGWTSSRVYCSHRECGTVTRLDTVKLALAMGMKLSLHGMEEAASASVG